MTRVGRVSLMLLLVLVLASPVWATVVAIETEAPLADHSEQAIRSAVLGALEASAVAALAMGLPWVQLDGALVLTDSVILRIHATDERADRDDNAPTAEPALPTWDSGRNTL